jgi:hypothetical protein
MMWADVPGNSDVSPAKIGVMSTTAGKGPGLVFHCSQGAVRVVPRVRQNRAVMEVLDVAGGITQIRLTPAELRTLAGALIKVAAALSAMNEAEDVTQS